MSIFIVPCSSVFRAAFFCGLGIGGSPYLTYYPAVIIAAIFGGLSSGPTDPLVLCDHSITWPDGTGILCERRERPQLLIDETGNITRLFTNVLFQGETWNQAVPSP